MSARPAIVESTLKSDGLRYLAGRPATRPEWVLQGKSRPCATAYGNRRIKAIQMVAVMPFARIPGPGECELYRPGHAVHFIQARLAWKTGHVPGHVLTIDDGIVTVATCEAVYEFQHHRLDLIRRAVDLYGTDVEVRQKGVLSFGAIELFCVKIRDGSPIGPCLIR